MNKMRMESVDITKQNIEEIGNIFPNCVTETIDDNGKLKKAINFKLLKQMLLDEIVEGDEAYEFTWVGKKAAIVEANKPIRKTLRPCPEESVNWSNTENLFIEGDNLDVLKLLQESYLGKIKMIYIDPPYNTGNDFIYRDNFTKTVDEYNDEVGIIDTDTGERLFKNTDSNGRFHSDWCSMIYPRLILARNLLRDDGVIFISIDDNEIHNLRKICDEIFGECNFVAQLTTVMNLKGNNDEFGFAGTHEYTLVYTKDKNNLVDLNGIPLSEEETLEYKFMDQKGAYKKGATLMRTGEAGAKEKRPKGFYPIYVSADLKSLNIERQSLTDIEVFPKTIDGKDMSWRRSPEFLMQTKEDFIITKTNNGISFNKKQRLVDDMKRGKKAKTLFYKPEYSSGNGTALLKELFGGRVFDNPKPLALIKDMLSIGSINVELDDTDDMNNLAEESPIILDFFSGSATTAHAIMQLNVEDGVKRKYIMVQFPEETKEGSEARKAGYDNICDLGKERIRRSAKKISEENPGVEADFGFRVFTIDDSNMNEVYYSPEKYSQNILPTLEPNIKSDRTDLDLLFGCLLEWGLPLSLPYSSEKIEGYTVHNYNDGDLIACFDENIPDSVIKKVAKQKPLRAVFRDSSFVNSPSKINVEEIFKLYAPDTVVKVI